MYRSILDNHTWYNITVFKLFIFTQPFRRIGYKVNFLSETSWLTKTEEPSLPYYLPIARGRIIGFIPFPKGISAMWNAVSLVHVSPCPFPTGTSAFFFFFFYYLTHSWEDQEVHTFPKGNCLRVNVIARLAYELAYYDSAVHRFIHYTTRTPPNCVQIICSKNGYLVCFHFMVLWLFNTKSCFHVYYIYDL